MPFAMLMLVLVLVMMMTVALMHSFPSGRPQIFISALRNRLWSFTAFIRCRFIFVNVGGVHLLRFSFTKATQPASSSQ